MPKYAHHISSLPHLNILAFLSYYSILSISDSTTFYSFFYSYYFYFFSLFIPFYCHIHKTLAFLIWYTSTESIMTALTFPSLKHNTHLYNWVYTIVLFWQYQSCKTATLAMKMLCVLASIHHLHFLDETLPTWFLILLGLSKPFWTQPYFNYHISLTIQ